MSRVKEDVRATEMENNVIDSGLPGGNHERDGAAAPHMGSDQEASRDVSVDERIVPASSDDHAHLGNRGFNPEESLSSPGEASLKSGEAEAGINARDAGDRGVTRGKGGTGHVRDVQSPRQQESIPPTRPMVPDKEDGEVSGASLHALKNYASRDSGAVMLESSSGSKGMGNLLVDDLDKYAISPCEEKQWAVFGLSEDIMVRTIKLISHEKYSSLVKEFQVLASPTYPVNEWLDLGTFTARYAQGEQTFEVPEPAFARYLKLRFISHYGREFYCTVTQVKVHGSTMLESFHDEWQQSSAEVREVQDFMMTKKETKHTASVANGSASGNSAKMPSEQVELPGRAQAPTSDPNQTTEGAVQHRPHAASAATVPSGMEEKNSPAVTEQVADGNVRGAPSEIVVPAVSCSGTMGTDGVCREDMFVDQRQRTGGVGSGDSASLSPGIPQLDSQILFDVEAKAGDSQGKVPVGVEGDRLSIGEVETEVVKSQPRAGVGAEVGTEAQEVSKSEPEEYTRRREASEESDNTETPEKNSQVGSVAIENVGVAAEAGRAERPSTKDGADEVAVDSVEGTGGETGTRKGIIHSTMEAISKAVHLSDGAKRKGDDVRIDETDVGTPPKDEGGAVPGEGNVSPTSASNPSSKAGVEAASDAAGSRTPEAQETVADTGPRNLSTAARKVPERSTAAPANPPKNVEAGDRSPAMNGSSTPPARPGDEADDVCCGESDDSMKHKPDPEPRQGAAHGIAGSYGGMGSSTGVDASARRRRGEQNAKVEESSPKAPMGSIERNGTPEVGIAMVPPHSESTSASGVVESSDVQGKDRPEEGNGEDGRQEHAGQYTTESNLSKSTGGANAEDHPSGGLTTLDMSGVSGEGAVGDLLDSSSEATRKSEDPVHLAGADAATLAAKCLDRLGFSEFQDEVLARSQQAQYAAGNSVMVGGQYESIFKTLTNKIKTLEINQSLFSLYLDEVHGCYQEVITLMLTEQARARATRLELLNIQSASLTKMGNHWPAFQELQVKVVEMEQRLLLGSMAWFLSILCLVIMMSNCCFRTCRLLFRALGRYAATEWDAKGEKTRNGRKSAKSPKSPR